VIVGWSVLRPSARERRLRQAAVATLVGAALGLILAALLYDPRHPQRLWASAGLSLVAAGWGWHAGRHWGSVLELAVHDAGAVMMRVAGDGPAGPEAPADVVFASPWLITLRYDAMFVPVWADALECDAFRRLHACARWAAVGRQAAVTDTGYARNDNDKAA
jgi:hypothetical protein